MKLIQCPIEQYFKQLKNKGIQPSQQIIKNILMLLPDRIPYYILNFIENANIQKAPLDKIIQKAHNLCLGVKIILKGKAFIYSKNPNKRTLSKILNRGDIIGRVQTLNRKSYFEQINCSQDYIGLSLKAQCFRKYFKKDENELQRLIKWSKLEYFSKLDEATLHYLISQSTIHKYSMNQIILKKNQLIQHVYLIQSGQIQLLSYLNIINHANKTTNNHFMNRKVNSNNKSITLKLAILGAGTCFADQQMNGQQFYSQHSAIASSQNVTICTFDLGLFFSLAGCQIDKVAKQQKEKYRNQRQNSKCRIAQQRQRQEYIEAVSIQEQKMMLENMHMKMNTYENWDQLKLKSYSPIKSVFENIQKAPSNVHSILKKYDRLKAKNELSKRKQKLSDKIQKNHLYKIYDKSYLKLKRLMRQQQNQVIPSQAYSRKSFSIKGSLNQRLRSILKGQRPVITKIRKSNQQKSIKIGSTQDQFLAKLKLLVSQEKISKVLQSCSVSQLKLRHFKSLQYQTDLSQVLTTKPAHMII